MANNPYVQTNFTALDMLGSAKAVKPEAKAKPKAKFEAPKAQTPKAQTTKAQAPEVLPEPEVVPELVSEVEPIAVEASVEPDIEQ